MKNLEDQLEVYLGPTGRICIAQRDMNEDCFIALAPEQVDTLIRWLQRMKVEAVAFRRSQPVHAGSDCSPIDPERIG
jgi:hypothetical protein